jgi:hypothetical protein
MNGTCRNEKNKLHRKFVGKPEKMKQLGRHRHRWEDNMKMDLKDTE